MTSTSKASTTKSGKNGQSSSRRLFVVDRVYCVLASLFFAACAYAQLNDPNPELWIMGYLTGGCLLNILVMMTGGGAGVRTVIQAFAVVNGGFLIWWICSVLPQVDGVDYEDPSSVGLLVRIRDFGWSVLEKEEGRNMGGLIILFSHVTKLHGLTNPTPNSTPKQASNIPWSHLVGTLAAATVIGFATYLWIGYQPDMNNRQGVEHCKGAFDGLFSSSSTPGAEEL